MRKDKGQDLATKGPSEKPRSDDAPSRVRVMSETGSRSEKP